jgi:trk system potassium uptake protein TrkA
MRVAIAGAGAVGRSIALELLENHHQVMLIERELTHILPGTVEAAEWVHADACELSSLEDADLESCDVVIAATGDDKVNLVVSLLAKTEFAVRRVVARVNDPRNEWLFSPTGASTWPCPPRGCSPRSSRRPWRWATSCGCSPSARARPTSSR